MSHILTVANTPVEGLQENLKNVQKICIESPPCLNMKGAIVTDHNIEVADTKSSLLSHITCNTN